MDRIELLSMLRNKAEGMDLNSFSCLAHFYNIEFGCIMNTPIYTFYISSDKYDVCSEINRIYKQMTCRNIISEKMTYEELQNKFKEIKVNVVFN